MPFKELGMAACRLWFVGTRDGEVTHGVGFPLPHTSGKARCWLIERTPGEWDVVNSTAGTYRVAFDNPEDAAKYLEHWCKERRRELGEAYRAMPTLMEEMIAKESGN